MFLSLVELWLKQLDLPSSSLATYRRNLRAFLRFVEQHGAPTTCEDIKAYRESLKQRLKPTTIQAYLVTLKQFFRWTAKQQLYPDLASGVRSVRIDRLHKKDPLSRDQVVLVLSHIERTSLRGLRDVALILLMATCGLRDIEVVRANKEDLQPQAAFVALFIQGKGHDEKADYVKVPASVYRALEAYLTAREKEAKRREEQRNPKRLPWSEDEGLKQESSDDREDSPAHDPLFASLSSRNAGQRLTTRSLSRIIKQRFHAAGILSPRLTAHSLRHTAATLNLLYGGTLEETQQFLRHTR